MLAPGGSSAWCLEAGRVSTQLYTKSGLNAAQVAHAHVDIAGPAWDNKASIATGMGATTLAEWACAQGTAPRDSK
jgi:leucyl aminopeptidase